MSRFTKYNSFWNTAYLKKNTSQYLENTRLERMNDNTCNLCGFPWKRETTDYENQG